MNMNEESKTITGISYLNKAFEDDVAYRCQDIELDLYDTGGLKESDKIDKQSDSNNDDHESHRVTPHSGSAQEGRSRGDEHAHIEAKGNVVASEVPDGGWGWIVAAGGFIGQTVVNTLLSSFGILYSQFLLDLGTSAIFSSWIFNIMGFMVTMAGVFVRGLVEEFGFRATAAIGTLMIFVGVTATAFVNSAWFLLIAFSLVAGTGSGLMAPLIYSVVPYYFKKRLGIANGIMSSGVSAGQIVGPLLIFYLQSEYGFQGAILLLGGFILQSFIAASVFHPLEWHLKVPRKVMKKQSGKNIFKILMRLFINALGNFKLMRSPVAVIVAVGAAFNVIGYLNFLTILPFAMQEIGFSIKDAAAGLTVSGFTNFCARIIVSIMADISCFNMKLCYMVGTFVVVALSIVFCFLSDLNAITILMGFWGSGVGAYMGLFNLVMVKYVGMQNILAEIGLTCFFSSFWFLSCGPIIGAIRDATGSYRASIFTLAGTMAITFVLYLFMPAAMNYEEKRKSKQKAEQRTYI